jgi:hypothetical protein
VQEKLRNRNYGNAAIPPLANMYQAAKKAAGSLQIFMMNGIGSHSFQPYFTPFLPQPERHL